MGRYRQASAKDGTPGSSHELHAVELGSGSHYHQEVHEDTLFYCVGRLLLWPRASCTSGHLEADVASELAPPARVFSMGAVGTKKMALPKA